jgi:hypothetical protein
MLKLLRPCAVLASCVLVAAWPGAAGGSEVHASDPLAPVSNPAVISAAPGQTTSTFSLTVSPTRLVIGPEDIGDTQEVRVKNGGDAPVTVAVQKRSFTARPDGTLAFQDEAPYSAAEWLTLDATSFELAPGASHMVRATITVPASPEPGDHQAALVFLVPSGATEDNVRINRGIAVPAFITVPGAVDDSVSLGPLEAKAFATGGPVTITAQLRNTGTVHRDFRGATPLVISGAGTGQAFPDFTVMRDATRQVTTTWDPPLLCICHPSVSVVGADGTVQSVTVRVIVFPLPLLGWAIGALFVAVVGVRWARRGYRANVVKAAGLLPRPVSRGDA